MAPSESLRISSRKMEFKRLSGSTQPIGLRCYLDLFVENMWITMPIQKMLPTLAPWNR